MKKKNKFERFLVPVFVPAGCKLDIYVKGKFMMTMNIPSKRHYPKDKIVDSLNGWKARYDF